uniref:Potassium channel, subfamily K, member 7 n=1 Tax=Gasterosteus aculeatus aculeatus TaxID=481459 RepID=A0AAQ4R773_GASAC
MARLASSLGLMCQVNAFAGLVLCYLLFLLLGGLVFTSVEKPVEKELRAEVAALRRSFLRENPCVQESELRELLGKAFSAHRSNVAVLKADVDERRYDFTSSLYFVIVTLTTMGSDSYTPKSDEAKLFCIFYCTLGIPLTLLLLTLLSKLLLPVVTHAPVHHLHTYWGLPYCRAALVHAGLLSVLVLSLLFLPPSLLVCAMEPSWSFLDALFFCFVVLSTVGQGGNSLGRNWSPSAKETLHLLTTCRCRCPFMKYCIILIIRADSLSYTITPLTAVSLAAGLEGPLVIIRLSASPTPCFGWCVAQRKYRYAHCCTAPLV